MPPDQNLLGEMLRYMRPAGGKTERAFNYKYLDTIEGMEKDGLGNRWINIPGAPIVWSCHTDTVHRTDGMQDVFIQSTAKDRAFAFSKSKDCLGADCTTGVFIMLHMLREGVPGLYLFHASEEVGCKGSRAIARENKETLKSYKACVAFDRKNTTNIITHQTGVRTASDEFAASLAKQLGKEYKADDTGMYTDSNSYKEIIPECTNISVGYYSQHSASECQDVDHALWLADKMTKINLDELVFVRDPSKVESRYGNSYGGYYGGGYRRFQSSEAPSIYTWCRDYPWIVAKFLETEGYEFEGKGNLEEYIREKYPNHIGLYKYDTLLGDY